VADVDGWRIKRYNDCNALSYREHAVSQDVHFGRFESRTDPVALLSTWEHQNLE
jgi:hypothetical protein